MNHPKSEPLYDRLVREAFLRAFEKKDFVFAMEILQDEKASGSRALMQVIQQGGDESVCLIQSLVDVKDFEPTNATLLRLLLDRGAPVNPRFEDQLPAVFAAAWRGHAQVVQMLLDRGAAVGIPGFGPELECVLDGLTSLESRDATRLLVEKAADAGQLEKEIGQKLLLNAITDIEGHEVLQFLLEKGVSPNGVEDSCPTPLIRAIEVGDVEQVRLLLTHGADSNRDWGGMLPLSSAVSADRLDIVRLLVNSGADPSRSRGKDRRTPLIEACRRESNEIVRLFVESGADLNGKDRGGYTALHCAAGRGNIALASLLLENGANPNSQSRYCTPLTSALEHEFFDLAKLLLEKGADPNKTGDCDPSESVFVETPLIICCTFPTLKATPLEVVELLLEKGADPNRTPGDEHAKPLVQLLFDYDRYQKYGEDEKVKKKTYMLAKALLDDGADPNTFYYDDDDTKDIAPLHIVAEKGYIELARLLLEKGAKMNLRVGENSPTPLSAAVSADECEMAQFLLENGADPSLSFDFKVSVELTPLMAACRNGLAKMVQVLLRFNADGESRKQKGIASYVSEALQGGHFSVAYVLLRAHPDALRCVPNLKRSTP